MEQADELLNQGAHPDPEDPAFRALDPSTLPDQWREALASPEMKSCMLPSVGTSGSQSIQLQVTTGMRGHLDTRFSITPDPGYRDVGGVHDVTVPVTVNSLNCAPRPSVTLTTASLGDRLRVTARAGMPPGLATNRLESIRFGIGTNALIDVGGATGLTGEVFVPFGDNR